MANLINDVSFQNFVRTAYKLLKQLEGKKLERVGVAPDGGQEFHFNLKYKHIFDVFGEGQLVLLTTCLTKLSNWNRESIKNYVYVKQDKPYGRGKYIMDETNEEEFQNKYEDLLCFPGEAFRVVKVKIDYLSRIEIIFKNYNHKLLISPLIPSSSKSEYDWAVKEIGSDEPSVSYKFNNLKF